MVVKYTEVDHSNHRTACDLLAGKPDPANSKFRTDMYTEKAEFIFENWNPDIACGMSKASDQSYFTPLSLARDAMYEFNNKAVYVDVCAGIGVLAYALFERFRNDLDTSGSLQVICIEQNPVFIEVGKILVPDAIWIEGDALDQNTWFNLPVKPDWFVMNPPYNVKGRKSWLYTTGVLQFLEAAMRWTKEESGTAILPKAYSPRISLPEKWCSDGYTIRYPDEYHRITRRMAKIGGEIRKHKDVREGFISTQAIEEINRSISRLEDEYEQCVEDAAAIDPIKEYHIVPHDARHQLDEIKNEDFWIQSSSGENKKIDEKLLTWMRRNGVTHTHSTFCNRTEYPEFKNAPIDTEVINFQREYEYWGKEWS